MGVVTKRTITEEVVSQELTVGDIIDNPTFDKEFAFRIATWENESDWVDIYNSRTSDDDVPAELLIRKVTYLTIVDGQLVIEVNM